MDFLSKRYAKDPSFVHRRIADECLLVPIRHQAADLQHIYVLNPVADRIWDLLDGKRTVEDIRDRLLEEFEVNSQELEQDLHNFLAQLRDIGGIREA